MSISQTQVETIFSEVYEHYKPDITRFCSARLRGYQSYVDDCTQETFLVFYNKLIQGESVSNPRAYLYKIADNICKAAKRKAVKEATNTVEMETIEDVAAPILDVRAADIDYDRLKGILISQLNESEQLLYVLKYEERRTLYEIGEILDIPPGAVANRTARLRTRIKGLIKPIVEQYAGGGVTL